MGDSRTGVYRVRQVSGEVGGRVVSAILKMTNWSHQNYDR
jgi:hypothetical protein